MRNGRLLALSEHAKQCKPVKETPRQFHMVAILKEFDGKLWTAATESLFHPEAFLCRIRIGDAAVEGRA